MLVQSLAIDFDDFVDQNHGQVNQCLNIWPEEKKSLDLIFKFMDVDNSRTISRAEFEAFYEKYEPTISEKTVQREFDYSDFNKDGYWTRSEICEGFIETRSVKVGELNDG